MYKSIKESVTWYKCHPSKMVNYWNYLFFVWGFRAFNFFSWGKLRNELTGLSFTCVFSL